MTLKNYATLTLVICACLVSGLAAYAYGGVNHLLKAEALLTLFGINLPFFILWGAATGAKGTAVPRSAIAISIAFILLDAAAYFGTGSKPSDSGSIVFGMVASAEIILPLLVVVAAIVSCMRSENDESNNAQ